MSGADSHCLGCHVGVLAPGVQPSISVRYSVIPSEHKGFAVAYLKERSKPKAYLCLPGHVIKPLGHSSLNPIESSLITAFKIVPSLQTQQAQLFRNYEH